MPSNSGSASSHQKLDKINLLFYSSTLAFLLMIPIFATSDLMSILSHISKPRPSPSNPSAPSSHSLFTNFLLNGGVHFLQNIIAFALLATTSPVTYSIASLIKRIAVICIAFVWFSQKVHLVQGFGIALTAVGLWLYNDAKSRGDVEKGEKKARRVENAWEGLLPTSKSEAEDIDVNLVAVPTPMTRPTKLHTHAHPPPLHIPPQTLLQKLPSPTEPYPSPPPSLDSPPPTAGSYFTTGIEVEQKALYNRRATLTSEGGFVGMPISVAS
jgi:solute carrier family 35 protein E1